VFGSRPVAPTLLALLAGLVLGPLPGCGDPPPSAAPAAPAAPGATGTAAPERAATPEIPADAPRVAFLGDSISAGLHLPRDEAFPAVLQRELAAMGVPFRLVNGGVSGDTTAGGLRRVDWLLRQDPAVVVVELGGNDGLRGVPLDEVERNLRGILGRIRESGARALLLGMRIPPNYGREYSEGFAALYARLGRELDVPTIPFFMEGVAGDPELNLPDGIHPTTEGHERLAETVLPRLRELLEAR